MTDKPTSGQEVLEEAVTIFDKVKSKIDGLIDCSVKDFELLNSNFKLYFNNLQKISEATNSFIDFILTANQHKDLMELSDPDVFDKEKIYKRLTNYTEQLKIVYKDFNYFLLIISNLKQDLSTIRLLFTNLRFDPSFSTDYKKINKLLDSIGNFYEKEEVHISKICISLNETINFTEEILFNSIEIFGKQIDKIREALMHLLYLSYSSKQQKQKLELLDSKRASSTSAIITNLQFQDILRQKIEHVQEAHNEITSSLKNTHHEGDTLTDDELFKIRDINTLQSAQLIHANQEYQRAVETIVLRISDLNTLLNNYQNIWNHFCKPESSKFILIKSKLLESKSHDNSKNLSLNHIYERFLTLSNNLAKSFNNSLSSINNQGNIYDELKLLREILNSADKSLSKNKEFNSIKQINGEFDKLEECFIKLSQSLKSYFSEDQANSFFPQVDIKLEIESIKKFSERIVDFYNLYLNNQIEQLNGTISIDLSVSFSVEQVSYYKTFEKEVKEIIDLLDKLLININITKKEIDQERLEHLKKLYTMESEHEVHNIVTGRNTSKQHTANGNDENEVEFF